MTISTSKDRKGNTKNKRLPEKLAIEEINTITRVNPQRRLL